MSAVTEFTTITTAFAAASPVPAGRIAWDAMGGPKFTPPTINPATPEDSIWVRPVAKPVLGTEQSFWANDSDTLRQGLLAFECFGPVGVGVDQVGAVARDSALIFHRQDFGALHFDETSGLDKVTNDGAWEQWNSYVGYYVQEAANSEAAVATNNYNVTQSAHGFTVNQLIGLFAGTWQTFVATAAGVTGLELFGFASYVPNANEFTVVVGDIARLTGHSNGTGPWYADQSTAGAVTTTKPTSGVLLKTGVGLDANRATVAQSEPTEL